MLILNKDDVIINLFHFVGFQTWSSMGSPYICTCKNPLKDYSFSTQWHTNCHAQSGAWEFWMESELYTHPVKQIWLPCANNTVVYSFEPIQGTLHKRKGFNLRALDKNIQYSKVEHHVQGFVHKMNKSIQSIVYEKCLYWLKFGCLPNWFLLKRWAFDVLLANGE